MNTLILTDHFIRLKLNIAASENKKTTLADIAKVAWTNSKPEHALGM